MIDVQSCCVANLNLLLSCRSHFRRRRRSSLLELPNVYRLFVRWEKKKWLLSGEVAVSGDSTTDCFHSRCRQLCKFIRTKESFYIRKKKKAPQASFFGTLTWPVFHCFVHQYGGHDVCQKEPGQYSAISRAILTALLAENAQL